MPRRDKNREMEERLARIEDGLARSEMDYAIRQLGDGFDASKFDPSKPVESLRLHQSAGILDGRRRVGGDSYATKLEMLYGRIVSAFDDYRRERASEARIDARDLLAPVMGNKIQAVGFYRGPYSLIYRTPETRKLDVLLENELKEGCVDDFETTPVMRHFVGIANEVGYFAAVAKVDLLTMKHKISFSDLDAHVKDGFLALQRFQRGIADYVIVVPIKLR